MQDARKSLDRGETESPSSIIWYMNGRPVMREARPRGPAVSARKYRDGRKQRKDRNRNPRYSDVFNKKRSQRDTL